MASYLILDLVMTASQRGPNVQLMGNPAVAVAASAPVLPSLSPFLDACGKACPPPSAPAPAPAPDGLERPRPVLNA